MTTHALVDTAEMPVWTADGPAPQALYSWGSYTDLGPFRPNWRSDRTRAPYAKRVEHLAVHTVHAAGRRKGRALKWIQSVAREVANEVALMFRPVGEFA